ncbi:rod shape-determining protein RodA [Fretibacter rubidus]|uniref:rod shape-determining protein RodA n=1 Tax=Fretibacter rubidus TaxID=570162 RepID=UPI00352BBC12
MSMRRSMSGSAVSNSLIGRLYEVNWLLFALVYVIGAVGVAMILAATDGVWNQGALQHLVRLLLAGGLMLTIALIDIRVWYYSAYPVYAVALLLLGAVDIFGVTVNGSQRWLDLPFIRLQPSEIMKVAIVLALARYYHDLPRRKVSTPIGLLGALVIIGVPMQFILRQPDLGTTILLVATGFALVFLAGVRWRVIGGAAIAAMVMIPLFFKYGLKDYQRSRIQTLLSPESDPTGASYHIIQSKIALGSGGLSGKGYMQGTQRQGEYVPENTTDFIFTVIGEEFGLIGCVATILAYSALMALCLFLSTQTKHVFSRLLILGITTTFALYVFINMAMVMGLIPVVGVPLPLISYGGTVILAVMTGFGLILSAHLYRGSELPRGGD